MTTKYALMRIGKKGFPKAVFLQFGPERSTTNREDVVETLEAVQTTFPDTTYFIVSWEE